VAQATEDFFTNANVGLLTAAPADFAEAVLNAASTGELVPA
jgi:hypothetical protein